VFVVLAAASASNYVERKHADAAKRNAEEARDLALVQKDLAEERERLAEEVSASLAVLLEARGRLAETVGQFRDALRRARSDHPDQPLHIATFMTNYAIVLSAVREPELAEQHFRDALDLQRANGARPVDLARTLAALGGTLRALGRYEEAVEFLQLGAAAADDLGPRGRHQNAARLDLGRTLMLLERFEEAEAALDVAWEKADDPLDPLPRQAARIAELMAELHDAWEQAKPGEGHPAGRQ
jgi:tetratricopeptide (TPR) repeat protein